MPLQPAAKIARELRQWKVLEFKLSGASDRAVARILEEKEGIKVSWMTVNKDWHRALREQAKANEVPAAQLREKQMLRYERLMLAFWPAALKGDTAAADQVHKAIRGIRDINQLDPTPGSSSDRPLHVQEMTLHEMYREMKSNAQVNGQPALEAPQGDDDTY